MRHGAALLIAALLMASPASADFLAVLRATDNTHSASDTRWMGGMVIGVFPVGTDVGKSVVLPTFWRITVTGVNLNGTEAAAWLASKATGTFKRRQYRFDVSKLPAAKRNTLLSTGAVTITKAEGLACVVSVQ